MRCGAGGGRVGQPPKLSQAEGCFRLFSMGFPFSFERCGHLERSKVRYTVPQNAQC